MNFLPFRIWALKTVFVLLYPTQKAESMLSIQILSLLTYLGGFRVDFNQKPEMSGFLPS